MANVKRDECAAATARQLTDKISHFFLVSAGASLLSITAGFLLNNLALGSSTVGPTIVMFPALLFGLSLLKRAR